MVRKLLTATGVLVVGVMAALALLTNHSYVTTPSMYPTIPPGSMIFVSHEQSYHVGEVIVFHANGLTWAHRLIKINPNGTYVTKGDNPENAPDVFVPALTKADVIGVVAHAPRWLGFPELIAHHPGYGLSWLRAELGVSGKLGLTFAVALISFVPLWRDRRRTRLRGSDATQADQADDSGDEALDGQDSASLPQRSRPGRHRMRAPSPKPPANASFDQVCAETSEPAPQTTVSTHV